MTLILFQTLKDRRMLAVNGDEASATLLYRIDEEVPGGDEAFLVGERDVGASCCGLQSGRKTRRADDRGHHPARLHIGGLVQTACAGGHVDARPRQEVLERHVLALVGGHGKLCPGAPRLFGQQVEIAVAGQRHDLETVAAAELVNHVQRVHTDRAGRAED